MTDLESILTIIIWVGYGAFSAYQTKNPYDEVGVYVINIFFAPLIFISRALTGALGKTKHLE
jgi:hypothetical protein